MQLSSIHLSGTTHDFEYKNLEPYLVQPTLSEIFASQGATQPAGESKSAAAVPDSPPSPPVAPNAAELAANLFGDPDLAKADGFNAEAAG